MKAINEEQLQSGLSSGSKERLRSYRKTAFSNSLTVERDKDAAKLVEQYLTDRSFWFRTKDYLQGLKNGDGVPFCRSWKDHSLAKKQVDSFSRRNNVSPFTWNRNFCAAKKEVLQRYTRYRFHRLEYHSLNDILDAVTDWSTSAGIDYLYQHVKGTKKRAFISDRLLSQVEEMERKAMKEGSFNRPLLMATRTQASGAFDDDGNPTNTFKPKMRYVQIVSLFPIISESRYAEPITHWLKAYNHSAIGKSDEALATWFNARRHSCHIGGSWLSLDYSAYDSTIPDWLLGAAWDIIEAMFDGPDPLLKVLREDFIHKNFVMGDRVIPVNHGTSSGSRFTAIVNGIVNELIVLTCAYAFGKRKELKDWTIMGDDNTSLWEMRKPKLMALKPLMASYILHNFGIEVNDAKSSICSIGRDPEFLSRFWGIHGPHRDKHIVASLLLYPEKRRQYTRSQLRPWITVWSYILAYPTTMAEFMDVRQFMRDHQPMIESIVWDKETRLQVPYNVRCYIEMEGKFDKGQGDVQHLKAC